MRTDARLSCAVGAGSASQWTSPRLQDGAEWSSARAAHRARSELFNAKKLSLSLFFVHARKEFLNDLKRRDFPEKLDGGKLISWADIRRANHLFLIGIDVLGLCSSMYSERIQLDGEGR